MTKGIHFETERDGIARGWVMIFFGHKWRIGVGYSLTMWTLGLGISWDNSFGVYHISSLCFYIYGEWPVK